MRRRARLRLGVVIAMSLINQVLKEIDQRENDQTNQGRVRSLPQSSKRLLPAWAYLLLALVLTVSVLLLLLFIWQAQHKNESLAQSAEDKEEKSRAQLLATSDIPVQAEVLTSDAVFVQVEQIKARQAQAEQQHASTSTTENGTTATRAEKSHTAIDKLHASNVQPSGTDINTQVASTNAKSPGDSEQNIEPAGDFNQSAGQMRIQVSQLSPRQHAERRFQQALVDLQAGRNQQGAQGLKDVLLLAPEYHEARQQLAVYYFSQGFLNDALRTLEQGLTQFPGEPNLLLIQARILERAGEQKAALELLSQVPNDLPLYADLLILRGALANELGQYTLASATYEALTFWRPHEGRWWLGLAVAKELLGAQSEAVQAYRRALDDPGLAVGTREYIHQRIEDLH